jgi:hypothetical protein
MRRTRSYWQYFLFAVPVVVVALGAQYLSKHPASRTIASAKGSPEDYSQMHDLQQKLKQKFVKLNEDEDAPEQDLKIKGTKTSADAKDKVEQTRDPASAGQCAPEEFKGKGPEGGQISKKDWGIVMDQFHDSKTRLIGWLTEHKAQFSEKTYLWMSSRISEARLQRPPSEEEPDLAWRGIGVATELNSKVPLIRVGSGFAEWINQKPQRARFELTRLLAQTWSPCEMQQVDSTSPWTGFLTCMDMSAEADAGKACGNNTYSEAGWAVSSAVAAAASPPGCRIPAFEKASSAQCAKKMGVSL